MPTATRSLAEVVLRCNYLCIAIIARLMHCVLAEHMAKFLLKRANLGEGGVDETVIRDPTGKVGGIGFGQVDES